MNTAEKLAKLATRLVKHHMPNAATIAQEGADELRKCYVGRKQLAENNKDLQIELIDLKVTYARLKIEYRKLQKAINDLNDATYRLGLLTHEQAE